MVTKTLKDLFHEIYTAKSSGDKAFVAKHPIVKKKDLDGNGGEVFNATNVKRSERKKERHGYEPGDDAKVYEAAECKPGMSRKKPMLKIKLSKEKEDGLSYTARDHKGRELNLDGSLKEAPEDDVEWFEEGYSVGDMVNVTNPKASAQYKLVGKTKTHYNIEKPNGEQMKMPKERIARVNKQAWELRKAKKATPTSTHTDIDEALRAVNRASLTDHLIGADAIKQKKDGTTRIGRGFFYRSGSTSDGHAERISKGLDEIGVKHKVLDHGTQDYKPFKGGATIWSQNHHWVDVKIHPGQKIEESLDEAVEVVKKDGMVTVHDGSHQSFPLHPEHQQKIAGLSKGEKTSFKDETGKTVTAERTGSLVHLNKGEGGRTAAVSFHHFKEDADQIDELSKATLKSYLNKKMKGPGKDYSTPTAFRKSMESNSIAKDKLRKEDIDESAPDFDAPERTEDEEKKIARGQIHGDYKGHQAAMRRKHGITENIEDIDELSSRVLGQYVKHASADSKFWDGEASGKWGPVTPAEQRKGINKSHNRVKGQNLAVHKIINNPIGAKVYANDPVKYNGKLTKEDIINKAIATHLPEMVEWTPMTKEEKLVAKLDNINESHVATLLDLFDTLTEDNQRRMIDSCDTQEGISELLNFAIENRGE